MKRALDNIEEIGTGQLKQRKHELMSEIALISKDNKTAIKSIMADYARILVELDERY